ncbi:MAG: DUF3078 domain-containing protein [Bacteroidales bacterium]|nr:DUF3078 domain-containing protein [Bacteroidales bacterium]
MFTKNLTLMIATLLLSGSVMAITPPDTSYWHRTTEAGLTFSQSSMTNWAAGGSNSVAVSTYLNVLMNYKKENVNWDNSLELGYGMLKTEGLGLRKNDDKINLSSKYGYRAAENWNYSALLSFKSQFANGYAYDVNDSVAISRFLAPAYILLGVGMDYKPNDMLSIFMSPLSARVTLVTDQDLANAGAYGVDKAVYDANGDMITKGSNSRLEVGASFKMLYKKEIIKNVSFQSTLQLFTDYIKDPQNVDMDWEVIMLFKVNQFIQANLNTHILYDHDINITTKDGSIGPRTQFKEVFGLGFVVKF